MATKRKKKALRTRINDRLNSAFSVSVEAAFEARHGIGVKCEFDIFAMRKITRRNDGHKMTKAQRDFLAAFELGYIAAWDQAEGVR